MTVAWITEIHNRTDTQYRMWCTVPPGPLGFLGVFDGKDYGNDEVPLKARGNYRVELCKVPYWNLRRHYRYLGGPNGTVRMYCATIGDVGRIVFANGDTDERLGDLPIGSPNKFEPMRLALIIEDEAITWCPQYPGVLTKRVLCELRASARRLAPAISATLRGTASCRLSHRSSSSAAAPPYFLPSTPGLQ